MALIIHARIRVGGPARQLQAFGERVSMLLAAELEDADIDERHTESELVYDLKVRQGIPFPAFVAASADFPELVITAEWVDPQAGIEGFATIRQGRLADHASRALTGAAANLASGQEYVAVAADGALRVALILTQTGGAEFVGYAVTATRDAMFRITREGARAELVATAGSEPAWRERWLIDFDEPGSEYQEIEPAEPVAAGLYQELERLAREFVETWIWFASSPLTEIITEKRRYEAAGYPVNEANIRVAKLRNMPRRATAEREIFEYSSLGADAEWIREVIEQCWARE